MTYPHLGEAGSYTAQVCAPYGAGDIIDAWFLKGLQLAFDEENLLQTVLLGRGCRWQQSHGGPQQWEEPLLRSFA